jgi:hypothetical protein
MNRFKAIGSALLIVPALALVSTQARSEFKCDLPSVRLDRVACEKAKESPSALRQYIQRVRMIDSLYFPDYVSEEQAAVWAQNEANRAPVKKARAQSARFVQENPGA